MKVFSLILNVLLNRNIKVNYLGSKIITMKIRNFIERVTWEAVSENQISIEKARTV